MVNLEGGVEVAWDQHSLSNAFISVVKIFWFLVFGFSLSNKPIFEDFFDVVLWVLFREVSRDGHHKVSWIKSIWVEILSLTKDVIIILFRQRFSFVLNSFIELVRVVHPYACLRVKVFELNRLFFITWILLGILFHAVRLLKVAKLVMFRALSLFEAVKLTFFLPWRSKWGPLSYLVLFVKTFRQIVARITSMLWTRLTWII